MENKRLSVYTETVQEIYLSNAEDIIFFHIPIRKLNWYSKR